ncbi:MAG: hypothetical protein QXT91_00685 [Candidatus Caldarchaeum sp.]
MSQGPRGPGQLEKRFDYSSFPTSYIDEDFFMPYPQLDPSERTFTSSLLRGGLGAYERYNPWRPRNYLEFLQYSSHLGNLPAPSETAFRYALGRMGLHPDLTRIQGGLLYYFEPNSRRWRVVGTAEQLYYLSLDIQRELERERVPESLGEDFDILYRVRPRSEPYVPPPPQSPPDHSVVGHSWVRGQEGSVGSSPTTQLSPHYGIINRR